MDVCEGAVVSFYIHGCKNWMAACTEKVPLRVARCAAEVADARLVVSRCSGIWEIDGFGPSGGPECTESDLEDVADGCVPDGCEPEVVARARECASMKVLKASIGFCFIMFVGYGAIGDEWRGEGIGFDGRCEIWGKMFLGWRSLRREAGPSMF